MSDELALALATFFSEDDWPAVFDTDLHRFAMRFQGKQADWACFAYALEEDHQFVFYSVAPIQADEAHRQAVAEYLMRANYGLILGNFELDFDDGDIRYKTSIDVEGSELTSELIRHVVYANVQAMDMYLPGVMLILADGGSPLDAIARVESDANGRE